MLLAGALSSIAGRWVWKALPYAFLALLAGVLYARGTILASRLEAAQERAAAAEAKAARATANGTLAVRLMAETAAVARERGSKIRELERRIRDAKKPLPAVCDAALDPLRVAVDGLRDLRAVRDPAAAPVPAGSGGTRGGNP